MSTGSILLIIGLIVLGSFLFWYGLFEILGLNDAYRAEVRWNNRLEAAQRAWEDSLTPEELAEFNKQLEEDQRAIDRRMGPCWRFWR